MRIVNLDTFIAMPEGTLYSKYSDMRTIEDGPLIKGESMMPQKDFGYQEINAAIDNAGSSDFIDKCDAMKYGETVGMDFHCQGRDGCFDEDQLFAVWDRKDVEQLVDRLKEALEDSK